MLFSTMGWTCSQDLLGTDDTLLPSGKSLQKAIEHGHRISEFSLKKMVIFHSYVSLPEGNPETLTMFHSYHQ